MTAYLIVTAKVDESIRQAFDTWYESKHLSDAKYGFNAVRAMRGWSEENPRIHTAFYEFRSQGEANAVLESETLQKFITEFDQNWKGKASRTREIINIKQLI